MEKFSEDLLEAHCIIKQKACSVSSVSIRGEINVEIQLFIYL